MEPGTESGDAGAGEQTTLQLRRAVEGDTRSLAWLVSRLSPLLFAQARYRLGPSLARRVEPGDLVNDVWLVALPRLGDLRARGGRLTPFLLRFLGTSLLHRTNKLLQAELRSRPAADLAPAPAEDAPGHGDLEQVPAETTGVVTAAVHRELHGVVLGCLDELEPRDREVLLLRGVEQHSNRTVAMLLGLSPQAAAVRYHRALKRLRERLPGSVFDELSD